MSELEGLSKLCGMANKQGYYTAQEWENKTGVNPTNYPKYIRITASGLCVWTFQAENLVNRHFESVSNNWRALGV